MRALVLFSFAFLAACGTSSSSTEEAPAPDAALPAQEDAGTEAPADAGTDAPVLTGKCADAFGSALTEGFGRLDGIVYAVQKPSDTQCVFPNDDHVVVQVLMNGAVYRMVVNVLPIRTGGKTAPLPAPAFAEGWHAGAPLDYVTTLGVHSGDFQASTMDAATTAIAEALKVGDPISVYATSGAGRPESTHLVHRNKTNEDGAIVVTPTTAPRFLLYAFDNQTF